MEIATGTYHFKPTSKLEFLPGTDDSAQVKDLEVCERAIQFSQAPFSSYNIQKLKFKFNFCNRYPRKQIIPKSQDSSAILINRKIETPSTENNKYVLCENLNRSGYAPVVC